MPSITSEQAARALELLIKHGSVYEAARACGMSRNTFGNRVAQAVVLAIRDAADPGSFGTNVLQKVADLLRRKRHGVTIEEVVKAAGGNEEAADTIRSLREQGYLVEATLRDGEQRLVLARSLGHRTTFDAPSAKIASADGVYRLGVATDMHLGSKYQRLDELHDFYRICRNEGVSIVLNAGNWIDGEAHYNRRDLLVHGVDGQIDYLVRNYPKEEGIITWAVTGDDHEGWYTQNLGLDIGHYAEIKMRSAGRSDWTNLGYMERDIALCHAQTGRAAHVRLVHPGGGSAYAISYSVQRLIESYDGGDKPAAIIAGHYHKMDAGNVRNVWYVQGGCFQDQTPFMRKKRIAAHVGGVIVTFRQDPETGALLTMGAEMYRYFTRSYKGGGFRYAPTRTVELPQRALGG